MTVRLAVLCAWLLAFAGPAFSQATAPATHPSLNKAIAEPAASPPLIDINGADEKTLDTLPNVGPARVKAIIANRPYTDKQQLVDRKVLPANVFAQVQDQLALVNVNTTPAAAMAQILPNVGPVRAQAIVDKRPYARVQDLVAKGVLTQGILNGIKGLVTTGG